jgi:hypothetical protein
MPRPTDTCWDDVNKSHRQGKDNPDVMCKYCGKSWISNSKTRVYEHMENCAELPERRHHIYRKEQEDTDRPAVPVREKRRPRTNTWFDTISEDDQEALTESLAEFFYGSGIALNLVSWLKLCGVLLPS